MALLLLLQQQSPGPAVPWSVFAFILGLGVAMVGAICTVTWWLIKQDRLGVKDFLERLDERLSDLADDMKASAQREGSILERLARLEHDRIGFVTKLDFRDAIMRVHRRQDVMESTLRDHARLIPAAPTPVFPPPGESGPNPKAS